MSEYEAYLVLLGFIKEKCDDQDKEWTLSVALDTLYNKENEKKSIRTPLITRDILDDMK